MAYPLPQALQLILLAVCLAVFFISAGEGALLLAFGNRFFPENQPTAADDEFADAVRLPDGDGMTLLNPSQEQSSGPREERE